MAAIQVRARLCADPSIGVADLENCVKKFLALRGESTRDINLYKFVLPPPGTSWKSSPSVSWLVDLAPLLSNYLCIAGNGVIPGKKHKSALQSLDKAMKLNDTTKSGDQWSDVIDDSIRMALSHLRQLALYDTAKTRAFRKMDVSQQKILQELLDKISVPEGSSGLSRSATTDLEDSQNQIVPASPEPASSTGTPAKESVGENEVDPATIFKRILQEAESDPSSVKSLRAPNPGSPGVKGSPERGFLGALLKQEEGLTAEEARVLQGYESRQPPQKNTKGTADKLKAKGKAKAKAAAVNIKDPVKKEGGTEKEPKIKGKAKAVNVKPSVKKEAEPQDLEKSKPTKRQYKPESELTRTQLRARIVSRAYHRTLDEALANGKTKDAGKKLARAAHAAAAAEFDASHPRETLKKKVEPKTEDAQNGQE